MRVLLTGHKGYIGSIMLPMLQAQGHEVVGLDSDLFEGCAFGNRSTCLAIQNTPYIKKDIREVTLSDLKGFDAVVHLCALSNDPLGYFNPEITFKINHEASVNLAKLAKKAGVKRYLFSSSCSVYGDSGVDVVTEDSKANPITPYAESKFRAEEGISKLADSSFCPTFMRSATAYGVSPMLRFDLVLNNFVAWAHTTGVILLKSDGAAWRPIVHIEDISRAFIAVLDAPEDLVNTEIFNVGVTEENYIIRDLAEIVKDVIPNSCIEYSKDAGPDKRSYKVEFSKIKRSLTKFKPQWNAQLGAKQLYETYKQENFSLEEFEGPRYRRIKHLEENISNGSLDNNLRWREHKK
ncbi:MAG: NAD-dependent dehydratase [Candidatus Bathyarchaeum sp.]|nr:MAG: NAD-dependent dehydratase [Candidatus Bathyarchaeum sp.]